MKEWLANSLKSVPEKHTPTMMSATPQQLEEFYNDVIK